MEGLSGRIDAVATPTHSILQGGECQAFGSWLWFLKIFNAEEPRRQRRLSGKRKFNGKTEGARETAGEEMDRAKQHLIAEFETIGCPYLPDNAKFVNGPIVDHDIGIAHNFHGFIFPAGGQEGQHATVHNEQVRIATAGDKRSGVALEYPNGVANVGQAEEYSQKRYSFVAIDGAGCRKRFLGKSGVCNNRNITLYAGRNNEFYSFYS